MMQTQITRQIHILGDSHTHALQTAVEKGWQGPPGMQVSARRFLRAKNGGTIGDVAEQDVLAECATLGAEDLVISTIGGNQNNVIGLIQHPQPFDMLGPNGEGADQISGTLIPRGAFRAWLEQGLRGGDCARIIALAQAGGKHRTVHLAPPPPKADVSHILNRPETHFAAKGIFEHGVTPAPLRLRLWALQIEVTRAILAPHGITVLDPPAETLTADGYLDPAYYGKDATHANPAYGTKALDQVAALGRMPTLAAGG